MQRKTKEDIVRDTLLKEIRTGYFRVGDRLPAEIELANRFRMSRPTVARALGQLQRLGILERRIGAGTFVVENSTAVRGHKLLGLLIPGLGATEIYEPMCASMANLSNKHNFSLLWSGVGQNKDIDYHEQIMTACARYREQEADGVFFAPVDSDDDSAPHNMDVLAFLKSASIPVVLLDRDVTDFPHRSEWDLVQSDHFHAGFVTTEHFVASGAQRIDFVYTTDTPKTVRLRIMGYQQALVEAGIPPSMAWIHRVQQVTPEGMRAIYHEGQAQHILCGNDQTAVQTIDALSNVGITVPDDVRIIGFNDLSYASTYRVPLTTWRHPCAEEGVSALHTLLDRINYPELPTRTVQICGHLVVRESA